MPTSAPTKVARLSLGPSDTWDISKSNARQFLFKDYPDPRVITPAKLPNLPLAPPRLFSTRGEKKGEGTFGLVYDVTDSECPEKKLVIKVSMAETAFFHEVNALQRLQSCSMANAPQLHHWFISDQPPPSSGNWDAIQKKFLGSTQSRKSSAEEKLFGYVIMEAAEAGSLRSFFEIYLDQVGRSWLLSFVGET